MSAVMEADPRFSPCLCGCGEPTNERYLYVLDALADGRTVKEVAAEWGVTPDAVHHYKRKGQRGMWPSYRERHADGKTSRPKTKTCAWPGCGQAIADDARSYCQRRACTTTRFWFQRRWTAAVPLHPVAEKNRIARERRSCEATLREWERLDRMGRLYREAELRRIARLRKRWDRAVEDRMAEAERKERTYRRRLKTQENQLWRVHDAFGSARRRALAEERRAERERATATRRRRREVRRVRSAYGWDNGRPRNWSMEADQPVAMQKADAISASFSDPTHDLALDEIAYRVGTPEWLAFAKRAPIIPADFIRRTIEGEIDLHVEADGEVWFGQPRTHDGPRFLSDVEGARTPDGLITSLGKMHGHGKTKAHVKRARNGPSAGGRRPSQKAKSKR